MIAAGVDMKGNTLDAGQRAFKQRAAAGRHMMRNAGKLVGDAAGEVPRERLLTCRKEMNHEWGMRLQSGGGAGTVVDTHQDQRWVERYRGNCGRCQPELVSL